MIMYAFDLRPIVPHIMELPQRITFYFFIFFFLWLVLADFILQHYNKPKVLIIK